MCVYIHIPEYAVYGEEIKMALMIGLTFGTSWSSSGLLTSCSSREQPQCLHLFL